MTSTSIWVEDGWLVGTVIRGLDHDYVGVFEGLFASDLVLGRSIPSDLDKYGNVLPVDPMTRGLKQPRRAFCEDFLSPIRIVKTRLIWMGHYRLHRVIFNQTFIYISTLFSNS